ncbi:MAG: hypothetical protein KJ072_20380 [Verrucomicrobia bacterium]|nr:hypothetical protein [Verrucomicrobiota bacterium]
MKRENKYGTALTAVGVLTLPFFVGIPLLAVGILLLIWGERIQAERWIRVLFWMVPAALALAAMLFLLFPIEGGHDAESSIARSILCVSPLFLAILISLAMAALTVAQFPSLSRKHRVMGLGFGVLCGLAAGVALVAVFPWQSLAVAGLTLGVWAAMAWRGRRRARRTEASQHPTVPVVAPASTGASGDPPVPVVTRPKAPRVRKPICGILAWVMPLSAIPVALFMTKLLDSQGGVAFAWLPPVVWAAIPLLVALGLSPNVRKSPRRILALLLPSAAILGWMLLLGSGASGSAFDGWLLLGLAITPLMIGLGVAPLLAIASLWRRERYPGLAVAILALYIVPLAGWLVLCGVALIHETFARL